MIGLPLRRWALAGALMAGLLLVGAASAAAAPCPDGSERRSLEGTTADVRTIANLVDDGGPPLALPTALVDQPFEVFYRASQEIYPAPVATWTAHLVGSDRTEPKVPVVDPDAAPRPQISLDAVGTWELQLTLTYTVCYAYTDEFGQTSPEITDTYRPAPVTVKIIPPRRARAVAELYRPSRRTGFPDPFDQVPVGRQIVSSRLVVQIQCGNDALVASAPLVWRAYVAYGGRRPKGTGKPTWSWTSRPTGCVDPPGRAAYKDWGPTVSRRCPPLGWGECWRIGGARGDAFLSLGRSARTLVELWQGNTVIAAYRLRFRAYPNLPNRTGDGPWTMVLAENDGRCERMPGGRCSRYRTAKIG